ncbi:MAG TPA: cysteine desulfurase family protein [Myxococcota bacterium]|nr:cysteine desulfurase family protein [Myxococcota bacterium]
MALKLPIYLDHHATTPLDPRVADAMAPYWSADFGNPSSASHVFGWRAEEAVAIARERLAAAIGAADPSEIVFTSGTTESDNLALVGLARAQRGERDHIVTCAIEHPAVLDTCRFLAREGCRLTILPVDGEGRVDPASVSAAITERTLAVSIMAANGEIGTLQPVAEIGRICRERGVLFHSDAAQAVGKLRVDVEAWGVDLLSMCAHKLYGPKGVGALYVRRRRPRIRLQPLLHGGGHEGGLRSGTLPVPLIVGFARAVELCLADLDAEAQRLARLRDALWDALAGALDGVALNGSRDQRLPGNLNVSFAGVDADALLVALSDVALSTGSACASGSGRPSHVLAALGLAEPLARSSLRFGIGRINTDEEIAWVAERLVQAVRALRGASR